MGTITALLSMHVQGHASKSEVRFQLAGSNGCTERSHCCCHRFFKMATAMMAGALHTYRPLCSQILPLQAIMSAWARSHKSCMQVVRQMARTSASSRALYMLWSRPSQLCHQTSCQEQPDQRLIAVCPGRAHVMLILRKLRHSHKALRPSQPSQKQRIFPPAAGRPRHRRREHYICQCL